MIKSTQKKTKAPSRADKTAHADHIWLKLLGKTTDVPSYILSEAKEDGRYFQILECLIALVFTEWRNEYGWFVTPLQGDGGLDFFGEKPKNRGRLQPLEALVIGQSKYDGGNTKLVQKLQEDIRRVLPCYSHQRLDAVYVVAARRNRCSLSDRERKRLHDSAPVPVRIIDIDELDFLIRIYFKSIAAFLRRAIATDDFLEIERYFTSPRQLYDPGWSSSVRVVRRVGAGVVFELEVHVRTKRLLPLGIGISWVRRPPELKAASATLLWMNELDDIHIEPWDTSVFSESVYCFAIGEITLGELLLRDRDGEILHRIDLGTTTVENHFDPPFHLGSCSAQFARIDDAVAKTLYGDGPQLRALVGPGGTGKTRIGREAAARFVQGGGKWIHVSCGADSQAPAVFLRDLVSKLFRVDVRDEDDTTSIDDALKQICRSPFARRDHVRDVVRYFLRSGEDRRADEPKILGQVLAETLNHVAIDSPIFLQISDLHRTSAVLIEIIENIVVSMRGIDVAGDGRHRVLFLLESRTSDDGRDARLLGRLLSRNDVITTSVFTKEEARVYCEHSLRLFVTDQWRPFLSTKGGQDFVDAISAHVRAPIDLPEVLTQLIAHGVLMPTGAAGRLEFHRTILSKEEMRQLARDTYVWGFLSDSAKAALKAAALFGTKIPKRLFEDILKSLACDIGNVRRELSRSIVEIDGLNDVSFSHESYFLAAKALDIDSDVLDSTLDALKSYILRDKDILALSHIKLAEIEQMRSTYQVATVRSHYMRAVETADACGAQHLGILARLGWLATFPSLEVSAAQLTGRELEAWFDVALKLLGDDHYRPWRERLEYARRFGESLRIFTIRQDRADLDRDVESTRTICRLRLANDLFHLARHREAIEELDALLRELWFVGENCIDVPSPDVKQNYLLALDRKGVALWFAGDKEAAWSLFSEVTRKAKAWDLAPVEDIFLLDFFAVRASKDPSGESINLHRLAHSARKHTFRIGLLAEAHAILCDILVHTSAEFSIGKFENLPKLHREASNLFEEAVIAQAPNEIVFSRLLMGIIAAFADPNRAVACISEARDRARSDQHHEFLWKCLVNLAQLHRLPDVQNETQCSLALDELMSVVEWDVDQQSAGHRCSRIEYYSLPLAHVLAATAGAVEGSAGAMIRIRAEGLMAETGYDLKGASPKKISSLLRQFRSRAPQTIIDFGELHLFVFA